MGFYDDLATVATTLLTDKGQTISFSRDNVISLDPVTGVETKSDAITFSGVGAVFDYNASEIDGTVIQQGDNRIVLESTATAPAIGDAATIGGVSHRVINVETVSPGGTVVIYKLQVRV